MYGPDYGADLLAGALSRHDGGHDRLHGKNGAGRTEGGKGNDHPAVFDVVDGLFDGAKRR